MYLRLVKGLLTFIPGSSCFLRPKGSGGTVSARYCYSVWLRHLVMLRKNGLPTEHQTIAELGPGDSLGIGLCAMLTGADKYFALDAVEFAENSRNAEILEQLLDLFKRREKIPRESEFPRIKPDLDSYDFPEYILTQERLNRCLHPQRIDALRKALAEPGKIIGGLQVIYIAPWDGEENIVENSVDLVFSQAVLEHVDDLPAAFSALYRYLKPGGVMSHDVDFKSHGIADTWDGHWCYSGILWKLIRGRRKHSYWLNRHPHSRHIKFIEEKGFRIVCDIRSNLNSRISRKKLAPEFKFLTGEDMTTATSFIQAVKMR